MTSAADAGTAAPVAAGETSDAVLERLTRLHPKIIDLSLGRIESLLDRLGHPERRLAPVIHLAGTNGKGSTLAFLRAMLEAAGHRVQAYTSPHLVRFHERIRLSDGLVEEAALIALLERCESANGPEPITFFEVTTAAAFLAFAEHTADVLLLETGLGGRLDATNVIARPALTVITPIALDHQHYLGDSLEEIAGEKAGILKAGVPCVVGPQPPQALAVIEARAADLGVPLYRHGRDWRFAMEGESLNFSGANGVRELPKPALDGVHQYANAALATACAEKLDGFDLDKGAIAAGIAKASWPGRLQRLTAGPLVEALPADWELWLDGGHNPAAGAALAEHLEDWREQPVYLIYGMLNTKASAGFLAPLSQRAACLKAVAVPGEAASLSAEAAAEHAAQAGFRAAPATSVAEALRAIATQEQGPARVLICGSLYLAGKVLAENS